MHEHEIDAIATRVAEKMRVHPPTCYMFTPAEAVTMKKFVKKLDQVDRASTIALVGFLVVGGLGLIVTGIVCKLKGTGG